MSKFQYNCAVMKNLSRRPQRQEVCKYTVSIESHSLMD